MATEQSRVSLRAAQLKFCRSLCESQNHKRNYNSTTSAPRAPAAPQVRYARKNEVQQLRMAFEQLDINKDGLIDAEELKTYFEAMGHKTKKESLRR